MEMKLLPWIEDDVAIEIIGKMISYHVRAIYDIIEAYECVGFKHDSPEVQQNKDYQYHNGRHKELHAEIQQIYHGEDREGVIAKAYNEYAPYVKGRYLASQPKRAEQIYTPPAT